MMTELARILRQRIEREGPMSVSDWMSVCLQHPDHGYYMTRDPFGRKGDFTTAPEVSQMFGELLGLWAAVQWQQLGEPETINLVELGPGRGTLMADALRAAKGAPAFLDAVHVHLVESSPILKARQRETLGPSVGPVAWHPSPEELPKGPTLLIANEFLDALPIEQVVMTLDGWRQRCVDWIGDRFVFVPGTADLGHLIPDRFRDAEVDAVYETSPAVETVVSDVVNRIGRDGGAALFIDYGYDADGLGETLQAVQDHDFADPLANPGEQDLTAHVNFVAVGDAAREAGARTWGPIGQGILLERLGLAARASALLTRATPKQAVDIAESRRRLSDPDSMGRLFKAIALTGPDAPAPPGFEEVSWGR